MRGHLNPLYLIALGSNVRHVRHGSPEHVVAAAVVAMELAGLRVVQASRVISSTPLGPSRRRYANGVAMVSSPFDPPGMLACLKKIEVEFGRRRAGRRWAARVLDLDIVAWSGGAWSERSGVSPGLVVPHVSFRERLFVLGPACEVAACWRDPMSGLSMRQLRARLTRPRPLP